MVLSKRERIILIVTLACVGILVVNQFVVNTVWDELKRLGTERDDLRQELDDATLLLQRYDAQQGKWAELLANGMRNRATAESKVMAGRREWSEAARLTSGNFRPEDITADKGMRELIFTVDGRGSLASVARFLYEIETSAVPVKVREIQLGTGGNDAGASLTYTLRLSILYISEESTPSPFQVSEADYEDI